MRQFETLRLKLQTLFISDDISGGLTLACCNIATVNMCEKEKHSHHFDLPLFFNMPKQFLASGGLTAECVQVIVM